MSLRVIAKLVFCLIILITTGCGQESDMEEDTVTAPPGDPTDQSPYMGAVVINDALAPLDRWGSDEYEIQTGGSDTPVIENDTLTVTMSYSGGCEAHDVSLVAFPSDILPESYPVHLDVVLAHNAHGDACAAYLTETYAFDLTPIKTRYQETYMGHAGTIILLLQGAPDDIPDLVYTFGS